MTGYFQSGGEAVRPSQGALAALLLARDSLEDFPKCATARELLDFTADLCDAPFTLERAKLLNKQLNHLRLPTDTELANRSIGTHYALRVMWNCIQAVLSESVGKEVRAWRCVASAALEAGVGMHAAMECGAKRVAAKGKKGKELPLARALRSLVDQGRSDADIFALLSNPDEISSMSEFPIEVLDEPAPDWKNNLSSLCYYPRGVTADSAKRVGVKTIKNKLADIRKSRFAS